jgi:hypothetical protein
MHTKFARDGTIDSSATELVLRFDIAMESRQLSPEEQGFATSAQEGTPWSCIPREDNREATFSHYLASGGRRVYTFFSHARESQKTQELHWAPRRRQCPRYGACSEGRGSGLFF